MCLKSCDIGLLISKIIDGIIVRDVVSVSPIICWWTLSDGYRCSQKKYWHYWLTDYTLAQNWPVEPVSEDGHRRESLADYTFGMFLASENAQFWASICEKIPILQNFSLLAHEGRKITNWGKVLHFVFISLKNALVPVVVTTDGRVGVSVFYCLSLCLASFLALAMESSISWRLMASVSSSS